MLTITVYKLTASTWFGIIRSIYIERNNKEHRKQLRYNTILKLEINYTLVAVPASAWTNSQTMEVIYVRAKRSLAYSISECHVRRKSISNAANRTMRLIELFGVIFMFGIILIKRTSTIQLKQCFVDEIKDVEASFFLSKRS